jgi:MFS family permease
VIPAFVAVVLLLVGVEEPKHAQEGGKAAGARAPRLRLADARRLRREYWIVVAIAAVLTLARFSEAFLVLRAQNVGLPVATAPWVMVVMSIVYAATAYPAGAAADRGRGPILLSLGLAALVASDIALAQAGGPALLFTGVALWGLHMGLTQGLLAALVAGTAPADLRGSAFGVFNLVCGGALLVASALAGWLWDAYGPRFTFYAGAAFTIVAWIALARHGRHATRMPGT